MLTKIVYNCDPESLGDISAEAFVDAFENEVRATRGYQNLAVEVTFVAGESEVTEFHSDDFAGDVSFEEELREKFRGIAEKAFAAACESGESESEPPYLQTDIEQDCGTHSSGLTYVERKTITTDYSDYGNKAWESLSKDDKEWWEETLSGLHNAYVDLESLGCDARAKAKEILDASSFVDLENMASKIWEAIEEATE